MLWSSKLRWHQAHCHSLCVQIHVHDPPIYILTSALSTEPAGLVSYQQNIKLFLISDWSELNLAVLGGLGTTWNKHYCMYTKENKILTMIPYTQTQGRLVRVVKFCCCLTLLKGILKLSNRNPSSYHSTFAFHNIVFVDPIPLHLN